jgi:transposase
MTIPGVDATVALSIVAAVGDFGRFASPDKLVSYLGLNPRVRQSGGQPASHGRITKQGRAHARGMLVEAAWVAAKTPGPLRAFFERVRARRGMQIAVVATARKLACLCWQLITKGEDYAFQRPSLTAQKLRALELRAGLPSRRGQKGKAASYSLKEVRARERQLTEQAEQAYRQLVADWQSKRPAKNRAATTRAWPPPMGRDFQVTRWDTLRGRAKAPDPALRSGSTTPTTSLALTCEVRNELTSLTFSSVDRQRRRWRIG